MEGVHPPSGHSSHHLARSPGPFSGSHTPPIKQFRHPCWKITHILHPHAEHEKWRQAALEVLTELLGEAHTRDVVQVGGWQSIDNADVLGTRARIC